MIDMRHATIREYGCTLCQTYHRQGDHDYQAHLLHQSRHGVQERPDPDRFVPPDHPDAYFPTVPKS